MRAAGAQCSIGVGAVAPAADERGEEAAVAVDVGKAQNVTPRTCVAGVLPRTLMAAHHGRTAAARVEDDANRRVERAVFAAAAKVDDELGVFRLAASVWQHELSTELKHDTNWFESLALERMF